MTAISLQVPASALICTLDRPIGGDDKIVIRPLALTDAPKMVEAISESLPELKKFMPWSHFPQTVDNQRSRIVDCIHNYWLGTDYTLGIFGATTQSCLGSTGFHRRTLNARGLEIGYWIRSSVAGKGIATASTRSLIVYGFKYLGLNRIQCGYNSNNIGSARVNEKCGFKVEGRFKNFETPPSPEMIQNGWEGSNENIVLGLYPDDIANLDWYNQAQSRLTVLDWLGRIQS